MKRDDLADLAAFVAIADAMSFTRAAAALGMSPSALSHAMKGLETRLGVRLLARTTRSVAPTEAGECLLETLRPALAEIGAGLTALGGQRDRIAGTVRLTVPKHAATTVLQPMLPGFLGAYPDIRVEVTIDDGLTDIVASRYDAGIRFGEKVAGDMIAVRIGPEIRSAVVAAPAYLAGHPVPASPQDLLGHRCINYRLAKTGGLYPWEFEKDGRSIQIRVDGPLVLNDIDMILSSALSGSGIAYLFEDQVAGLVEEGRLVRLLDSWCWAAPGYHLYYPSRRTPPALAALVDALRTREPEGGVRAPTARTPTR